MRLELVSVDLKGAVALCHSMSEQMCHFDKCSSDNAVVLELDLVLKIGLVTTF